MTDLDQLVVSVLGGTGEQGRGLARRFALAGHRVVLGSRSAERATEAAQGLPGTVTGAANADAAAQGDVVIVAVPWD
ncbi:MAG: NAD(P)-binding domain-containing protein, partial [Mycobacteriales bacterium]